MPETPAKRLNFMEYSRVQATPVHRPAFQPLQISTPQQHQIIMSQFTPLQQMQPMNAFSTPAFNQTPAINAYQTPIMNAYQTPVMNSHQTPALRTPEQPRPQFTFSNRDKNTSYHQQQCDSPLRSHNLQSFSTPKKQQMHPQQTQFTPVHQQSQRHATPVRQPPLFSVMKTPTNKSTLSHPQTTPRNNFSVSKFKIAAPALHRSPQKLTPTALMRSRSFSSPEVRGDTLFSSAHSAIISHLSPVKQNHMLNVASK
jgi:hypothetical protein